MIKNCKIVFLISLILSIFILTISKADTKCLNKTGLISDKYKYLKKDHKFKDPKNTIIFLFNHGGNGDRAAKKDDCPFTKKYIKNVMDLSNEDFGINNSLVYLVNTKPLWGDAYKNKKSKTKWLPFPGGNYPGKTKTEKKIDLTNEIIDNLIQRGIDSNNIIISGHSCGGWLTLLYVAQYPEKVRGGIAYHPACYGELTVYKIWTEKGRDDYLWDYNDHEYKDSSKKVGISKTCDTKDKYAWEYACAKNYLQKRASEIEIIKSAKNPRVVVIHNEDDGYEGKTSKWLKDIKSVEFIETPTKNQNYKINKKSCTGAKYKDWYGTEIGHTINESKCMSEFFPRIVKYFKN